MLTKTKFKPLAVIACLFLVALALLCLPNTEADAATYSGYCGTNGSTVNWEVNTNTGVLSIIGTGNMASYSTSYTSWAPWYTYNYYIESIVVGDGVTNIGSYAFYNLSHLTNVTIADSVTYVGTAPFSGCSSLTRITVPFIGQSRKSASDTYQYPLGYLFGTESYIGGIATLQYYYGSSTSSTTYSTYYVPSSLNTVTVTDSIIPYGAFYNCASLTTVSLSKNITSIGDNAFYNCSSLKNLIIPSDNTVYKTINGNIYSADGKTLIKYLPGKTETSFSTPAGVTTIADRAFNRCLNLTSITIDNSVTSIGDYAFDDCFYLSSISIGKGVIHIGEGAFADCTTLSKVNITDIANWCKISFGDYTANPIYYAKSLYINSALVTSLVIPNSITAINDYAFYNCSSLSEISIPNTLTSIGVYSFKNCDGLLNVTIPGSVTKIGEAAFSGCSSLESITIPFVGGSSNATNASSTTLLGYIFGTDSYNGGTTATQYYADSSYYNDYYVSYCIPDSLRSVTVTGGKLLYGAFYNCRNLTSIIIGDNVSSVGASAFCYCSNLTNVIIGNNVSSIAKGAFRGCSKLESITIPFVNDRFGYIFGTVSYTGGVLTNQSSSSSSYSYYIPTTLKSVTVTSGSIWGSAFYNCSNLTNVTIGDGVTSIGESAFYNCSNLTSLTVGKNVTSIGNNAFYNCKNLANFSLPDNITHIGTGAFANTKFFTDISNLENGVLYIQNYLIAVISNDATTELVIKNGTTVIADKACGSNNYVTKIVIPDSVIAIGNSAFYYCSNLTEITIGSGVTRIDTDAFYECTKLTQVNISDIGKWCEISFGNATGNPLYYAKEFYVNGVLLTELTIPEGVEVIGYYAFYDYQYLTSVTIPDSVTTIGEGAFYDCNGLLTVTIGRGVRTIGKNAFYSCTALKTARFNAPCGWYVSSSRYFLYTELSDVYLAARYLINDYYDDYDYDNYTWSRDNHEYTVDTVEATCTTDGYTTYTCLDCSYTSTENVIHASGHAEYETVIILPTCTGGGCTVYTCTICGDGYIGEVSEALGHTEVTDNAVAPTCTELGLTEGSHCSVCDAIITKQEAVPRTNHTYEDTVIPPDCTHGGHTIHVCSTCQFTYIDEYVDPTGHTPVTDAAVAPTCTETGLTEGSHCSVCDAIITKQEAVPKTDHTYEDTVIPPDCTHGGHTIHVCSTCQFTYIDEYIDPSGHTEVTDEAITPTCTEIGYTEGKHCSVCNEIFAQQTAIAPKGHADTDGNGFCDSCALDLGKRLNDGAIIGIAVAGAAVLCGAQFVITMAISKKKFMRA